MKVFLFANNSIGLKVARLLGKRHDDLVGLAVHPSGKAKFAEEIRSACSLDPQRVFDGSRLGDPDVLAAIRDLGPDMGVSISFGYILKPALLDLFPAGIVNLHPGLLPYNRGAYPNVWSIIDGTPAGVTIHYIDSGVDTGPILAQCEVPVEPADTGMTLHQRLEDASLCLFEANWPLLLSGKLEPRPQTSAAGTYHRVRDTDAVDRIDPDRSYTARNLLNIIRARTFPPFRGAYFTSQGRRIGIRVELTDEGEDVTPR